MNAMIMLVILMLIAQIQVFISNFRISTYRFNRFAANIDNNLILVGSFECACKSGFKGNGLLCFDIDECATGTHTCADGEGCINNKGSFECSGVACPPSKLSI